MSDLPDYTKYIAPSVAIPIAQQVFGTKAETVTKYHVRGWDVTRLDLECDPPPAGKKVGLILIHGIADVGPWEFALETLQSGSWEPIISGIYKAGLEPVHLRFPCWIPPQDVGDGVTKTVRISVIGPTCPTNCSGFILHFFE